MIKTHRVGTLTLGSMLVTFGILFLMQIFISDLTYGIIFKLWPLIFIFLGLEILIANIRQSDEKLHYDKGAIVLMIILSFFAMGMAITDFCIRYADAHFLIQSYRI